MDNMDLVLALTGPGRVLDLACGSGVHGLVLAEKGVEVHFFDKDEKRLETILLAKKKQRLNISVRQTDLENGRADILPEDLFRAVMVFRYLHRPLMPQIKQSVRPGGVVIYETFTFEQARLGKPSNPDFLLKDNELLDWFRDWQVLKHYQGRLEHPERYMAGILARKKNLSG
ncbi:MAG: methyltransferase domain-containing protein [Desulfonatronovibrionaceae bacterium]